MRVSDLPRRSVKKMERPEEFESSPTTLGRRVDRPGLIAKLAGLARVELAGLPV